MSVVGHNQPPSLLEFAAETTSVLGAWLKEHPVVQTEDEARDYKLLRDRGKACLQDLEAERKLLVKPLQEREKEINDQFRSPRILLEKTLGEGDDRINAWIRQEEKNRQRIAEEARRKAEEAERLAREAEARELEAKEEAKLGVETDVAAQSGAADRAFENYQRLERAAARAEVDTVVKVSGGFKRSLSSRFKEELFVDNPAAAVAEMGWSERLIEAILTDAREFRRSRGRLPQGITSKTERSI